MEDRRECLVCSVQIGSVHLGMDICRPCASFYKRAKKSGVQYPCRQGTHQCGVTQDTKFMCRGCRLDKCISVGVVYDGPLRSRPKPPTQLLERVAKEFKSMIERRRARELEFVRTCAHRRIVPHPKELIYVVNAQSSAELLTIGFTESLDSIFKEYVIKLGLIVNYFLTMKLWGEVSTKVMSSVTTCYDHSIPFEFYYPDDNGNKEFFKSSIQSYTDDHTSIFLPQLKRAELTVKEYHALAVLALTDHGVCRDFLHIGFTFPRSALTVSEETSKIMDDIRREVFENLLSYYKNELGLTDFSTRLGNLMSFNHIIQECQYLHKEIIRFYSSFFDIYMAEKLVDVLSLY